MAILKNKILLIVIAAVLLLALLLLRVAGHQGQIFASTISEQQINSGVSFIQGNEAKDPKTVDETIRALRAGNPKDIYEDQMAKLSSNPDAVWSMFEDYALLGDSRAVGFTYYNFLPESNVWALSGATIRDMEEKIPQLLELAPGNIFLCYGMNDFCSGIWDTAEEYIAEYRGQIELIQSNLPDARVLVCSILPASEIAYERTNIWSAIPDYNDLLREMCDQLPSCYYIDCDAVSEEYMEEYWQEDGIHFDEGFYPYWAGALIEGMLRSAIPEESE